MFFKNEKFTSVSVVNFKFLPPVHILLLKLYIGMFYFANDCRVYFLQLT